jgi:hypothetical protein
MMHALAADDSKISFEGSLSQTELAKLKGATDEESDVLKRATLQPKLDFLILPLREEDLSGLAKAVISKIAFGLKGILHVQIEKNGKIEFAAFDNFDRDCVVAYSGVSPALLDELTRTGVLWGYSVVPDQPDKHRT